MELWRGRRRAQPRPNPNPNPGPSPNPDPSPNPNPNSYPIYILFYICILFYRSWTPRTATRSTAGRWQDASTNERLSCTDPRPYRREQFIYTLCSL